MKEIYLRLRDNLQRQTKKPIEGSIIPKFLDLRSSNKRFDLLNASALASYKIPKNEREELLERGLIREADSTGNYTITAKGIWEIENKEKLINTEKLIDFLEKKFFEKIYKISEKTLNPKEKVVIFSMIATRAFSDKSCVDLKKDDIVIKHWKDVLDESSKKLEYLNLIPKMNQEDLYGKSTIEKAVSNLIRHSTELTKKTHNIYKSIGNQKHFLDISDNLEISKEKLHYLFKRIFNGRSLDVKQINDLIDFCHKIATTKNIYLFDNEHPFNKPRYDDLIRDSLLKFWT